MSRERQISEIIKRLDSVMPGLHPNETELPQLRQMLIEGGADVPRPEMPAKRAKNTIQSVVDDIAARLRCYDREALDDFTARVRGQLEHPLYARRIFNDLVEGHLQHRLHRDCGPMLQEALRGSMQKRAENLMQEVQDTEWLERVLRMAKLQSLAEDMQVVDRTQVQQMIDQLPADERAMFDQLAPHYRRYSRDGDVSSLESMLDTIPFYSVEAQRSWEREEEPEPTDEDPRGESEPPEPADQQDAPPSDDQAGEQGDKAPQQDQDGEAGEPSEGQAGEGQQSEGDPSGDASDEDRGEGQPSDADSSEEVGDAGDGSEGAGEAGEGETSEEEASEESGGGEAGEAEPSDEAPSDAEGQAAGEPAEGGDAEVPEEEVSDTGDGTEGAGEPADEEPIEGEEGEVPEGSEIGEGEPLDDESAEGEESEGGESADIEQSDGESADQEDAGEPSEGEASDSEDSEQSEGGDPSDSGDSSEGDSSDASEADSADASDSSSMDDASSDASPDADQAPEAGDMDQAPEPAPDQADQSPPESAPDQSSPPDASQMDQSPADMPPPAAPDFSDLMDQILDEQEAPEPEPEADEPAELPEEEPDAEELRRQEEEQQRVEQIKQEFQQKLSQAENFDDLAKIQDELNQEQLPDDVLQELQSEIDARKEQMKDELLDKIDEMEKDGFLDEEAKEELEKKIEDGDLQDLDQAQNALDAKSRIYEQYLEIVDDVEPLVDEWYKYFADSLPRKDEILIDEDSWHRQGKLSRRAIQRPRNIMMGTVKNPRVFRPEAKPRFIAVITVDVSGSMAGRKLHMARKMLVFYAELFTRISKEFGYIHFAINIMANGVSIIKDFDHDYDSHERYDTGVGSQETVKVRIMEGINAAGGTNILTAVQQAARQLDDMTFEYPDHLTSFYLIGDGGDTCGNQANIRRFLEEVDSEKGFGEHYRSACVIGGETERLALAAMFGEDHVTVTNNFDDLVEQQMEQFDSEISSYVENLL